MKQNLQSSQKRDLLAILALIGERELPSNNTVAMLTLRSGLDEGTVEWCCSVLFNAGEGWLTFDAHPKTGEHGYVLGLAQEGDLKKLHASWAAKGLRVGQLAFDGDDEDPDDEWEEDEFAHIDDEDDD